MVWENSGFPEYFCQLFLETLILPFHYFLPANDLSYRSMGSIAQAGLGMPDSSAFTAMGSVLCTGSLSFGARSLAGIGNTCEPGYVNSIGKDLTASGRFNIVEEPKIGDSYNEGKGPRLFFF